MTVGDGPYPDAEIAEALGVEVLARLPWDPDAAEALVSVPASARELRLAPLVRAARTLADQLDQRTSEHSTCRHRRGAAAPRPAPLAGAGRGARAGCCGPGEPTPKAAVDERERSRGGVTVSVDTALVAGLRAEVLAALSDARAGAGRRRPPAARPRPTSRPSGAS